MSFPPFNQDLTVNLSLTVSFLLQSLGISNSDLYDGVNFNDFINDSSKSYGISVFGTGTLTDGTRQTALTTGRESYTIAQESFYTRESNLYNIYRDEGYAYVNLNRFNLPSDYVDRIIDAPRSTITESLDDFVIGQYVRFYRFYGFKYIHYMIYNLYNTLTNDLYRYLYIDGQRTGFDIIGSGSVTYSIMNNQRRLMFSLSASGEINTYSSGRSVNIGYPFMD